MGSRWDNFIKSLKDFWQRNMERDYKKISAGLGVLIITTIWALADVGIAVVTGGAIDWGAFGTKIIVGLSTLGSFIAASFFGRENNNSEVSETTQ